MGTLESGTKKEPKARSLRELLTAHEGVRSGFAFFENQISPEEATAVAAFYRHPLLRYKLGTWSRFSTFDFAGKNPRLLSDHFDRLRALCGKITDDESMRADFLAGLSVIERDILAIESASDTHIHRLVPMYRRQRFVGRSPGPGHEDELGEGTNIYPRRIIRNFIGPATGFSKGIPPDGSTTQHWGAVYHWEPGLARGSERCSLMMEMGASLL